MSTETPDPTPQPEDQAADGLYVRIILRLRATERRLDEARQSASPVPQVREDGAYRAQMRRALADPGSIVARERDDQVEDVTSWQLHAAMTAVVSPLLAEQESQRDRTNHLRAELAAGPLDLDPERATDLEIVQHAYELSAERDEVRRQLVAEHERAEGWHNGYQAMRAERDEAIERAENAVAEAVADQATLKGLTVEEGAAVLELGPPREVVIAWVDAARKMLGEAENYAETWVDFPRESFSMEVKAAGEFERYVFTVQRAGKLTPHEARKQAEAERDRAQALLAEIGYGEDHSWRIDQEAQERITELTAERDKAVAKQHTAERMCEEAEVQEALANAAAAADRESRFRWAEEAAEAEHQRARWQDAWQRGDRAWAEDRSRLTAALSENQRWRSTLPSIDQDSGTSGARSVVAVMPADWRRQISQCPSSGAGEDLLASWCVATPDAEPASGGPKLIAWCVRHDANADTCGCPEDQYEKDHADCATAGWTCIQDHGAIPSHKMLPAEPSSSLPPNRGPVEPLTEEKRDALVAAIDSGNYLACDGEYYANLPDCPDCEGTGRLHECGICGGMGKVDPAEGDPSTTPVVSDTQIPPDTAADIEAVKRELDEAYSVEPPTLAQTRTGTDWCPSCRMDASKNRYSRDGVLRCDTCSSELVAKPEPARCDCGTCVATRASRAALPEPQDEAHAWRDRFGGLWTELPEGWLRNAQGAVVSRRTVTELCGPLTQVADSADNPPASSSETGTEADGE